MVNASVKVIFNKQRIKKDGTARLYLRVIIEREKKDIDLKLCWPHTLFDEKKGRCMPAQKNDETSKDYNVILSDAEARATEVFVQYRLKRQLLSLEIFLKEYHSNLNRDDFFAYYETKLKQRYKSGEITHPTFEAHLYTLKRLRAWKSQLLFSELNNRTAHQFDAWLAKKTEAKSINGRWGHHKNFRTYLNSAKKLDEINFTHPYHYFKAKTEQSRFMPLTKEQLIQLFEYYEEPLIHPSHKKVLRAFLFACFTGMRHSDVRRITLDWIDGEFLEWIPYKTRRFGTKVRMPLTKEAMSMLADELEENPSDRLFRSFTNQVDNRYIDEIGELCDIKMQLCFQIARETFATLYMEEEGKLEVLASFLGHKTTQQSEKYIKIMDQRKKAERVRISNFVRADSGQTDPTGQTARN
jgi:integrase